jgi:hypothetical protein
MEDRNTLMNNGFTGWWVANARSLDKLNYIVLCHNARQPNRPTGAPSHGAAFFVCRYSGYTENTDGRKQIFFDAVANVNIPNFWRGRNPVQYYSDEELEEIFMANGTSLKDLHLSKLIRRTIDPPEPSVQDTVSLLRKQVAEVLGVQADDVVVTFGLRQAAPVNERVA